MADKGNPAVRLWPLLVLACLTLGGACVVRFVSNKRAQQRREATYQQALRTYSELFQPGATRKDIEGYLRANGLLLQQMCCMESSPRNAEDTLTKIGEESPPWYCSAQNVYIGFEFVPDRPSKFPEAHDSDRLRTIRVFHWLEGCL